MIVNGRIANEIVRKTAKNNKPFYVFRLAENQGKDEFRKTTWYDVVAFISELDADLLSKGQYVRLIGSVEPRSYTPEGGGETRLSLSLTAFKVEIPEPLPPREGGDDASGGAPAPRAASGTAPRAAGGYQAPRNPVPARAAPAPRPAPPSRPASGFDDMDDDIPF